MRIEIPHPITLKDLADKLGQKPFRVVADAMELGKMKFPGDAVEFEMATKIAKKYGYETARQG